MTQTPKLLSGGNPQIPKGDGPAVVDSYLAAMPDWKQTVGRDIDRLIMAALPDVRKAVRWNSPFYGTDGAHWFLSFHCMTRYIKVAFWNGNALVPPPPVASKKDDVRYLHITEGGIADEGQFTDWVRQASAMTGAALFRTSD